MGDHERGRNYKKKYISKDTPNNVGRNYFGKGSSSHKAEDEDSKSELKVKQPTILLKAREQTEESVSSPKKVPKETESTPNITGIISSNTDAAHSVPQIKHMQKAMKFLDEGILFTDSLQDYVQEHNDFLVIGIVGAQGVGKSTILNLLANKQIDKQLLYEIITKKQKREEDIESFTNRFINMDLSEMRTEKEIFRTQTLDDIENNRHRTNGINIFISDNRVIFLDCQPFISMSIIDDLVDNENKRSNLVSEFIPSENSGEIQALQITSFLMSVCHILLVVQDWFFDSNVCRFIQTAEMLKPTMPCPDDEIIEHFPHLLMIHNKASVDDFSPQRFKTIQKTYKTIFNKSKLMFESSLGIASGRLVKHLSPESCGTPYNIFLIPEYIDNELAMFRGHPSMEDILKKLKSNLFGATKHPLSHIQLTERTWLAYCSKVWENVRKNSFFVEYTKLMP